MQSSDKARLQALRLIKVRPRSEGELKSRLAREGYGADTIESLLSEFKSKGLLDDAKFARFYAAQRMMLKPMGRQGLLRELKEKGIDPALAVAAAEEAAEGEPELERARKLAQGRLVHLQGLPSAAVQRRLFGFLSRRGFSTDLIYRVVKELGHEQL